MSTAIRTAVVAVGGNALIRDPQHTSLYDQYESVRLTVPHIVDLIADGWRVVLTHGNGPQVGFLLRKSELSSAELPPAPLDYCGSNTQGSIGYMFEVALYNEFRKRGMPNRAVALISQTVVDRKDPGFAHPTKPVGSFMDAAAAEKHRVEDGWTVMEDSGRGWRRVVPSPAPLRIVQETIIRVLIDKGETVIAAGGGGIPVVEETDGTLSGVEAVIDKDYASALLAGAIDADLFVIATEVEKVCLDFNKPTQRELTSLTVAEAEAYLAQGQFGKGSMEPKIRAVLAYLAAGGHQAVITNAENLKRALQGETGTRIIRGGIPA
ncbi:MAG: carbamate kinase [Spirochaetales bacterium]